MPVFVAPYLALLGLPGGSELVVVLPLLLVIGLVIILVKWAQRHEAGRPGQGSGAASTSAHKSCIACGEKIISQADFCTSCGQKQGPPETGKIEAQDSSVHDGRR